MMFGLIFSLSISVFVEKITMINSQGDFIIWLGHSSFLIKMNGLFIYTDPIIYDNISIVKRRTPLPISKDNLPSPDIILISHNHYDHMDLPSLRFLSSKASSAGKMPVVIVPKNVSYYLRDENFRVIELDWGNEFSVKDVKITSVRVKHFSGRFIFDNYFSKWNGYLISGVARIFFAGDTAYIKLPAFEPDIALMPIGAWKPRWFMKRVHVDPCEAVVMAHEMKAKLMIPMHFATFRQGADTPGESIDYMKECAEKYGVRIKILNIGEVLNLNSQE